MTDELVSVVNSPLFLLLLNGVLGVFGMVLTWFIKSLFTRIDKFEAREAAMHQDLVALRVSLPERFVTKLEHKDALDNIFNAIRRMEDKLDKKIDR